MSKDEIKRLRIRRGGLKAQVTSLNKTMLEYTEQNQEFTTDIVANIKDRLQKLDLVYDSFNDIQNELEFLVCENEESLKTERQERDKFYDEYYKVMGKARVLISHQNNDIQSQISNESNTGSQSRAKCAIKLPAIKLPNFDGAFTQWRSFYDSFTTLIHNNDDLWNVQKLTYLKSSLKGEPYDLISTLETTDNNYSIAWESLEKRYNNTRRIINNHVQTILNIHSISRENPIQLKELINTFQTHLNCLRSLKMPVDSWNAILVPIIISKLDSQTIKEWETNLNAKSWHNDTVPSVNEFIEFLMSKLATLEIITQKRSDQSNHSQIKSKSNPFTSRSYTAVESSHTYKPLCPNCSQEHLIYHCDAFLKLDEQSRNSLVRKLKLCLNCLRNNHFQSNCTSKSTCKTCHKNHNTLLHISNKSTNLSMNAGDTETHANDTLNQTNKLDSSQNSEVTQSSSFFTKLNVPTQTLLSTAVVHIKDDSNKIHNVRMLLDNGSQSNFISNDLCTKLNLKRKKIKSNIIRITQNHINISESVEITFMSRYNNFRATIKCLVLPQIATQIPSQSFKIQAIKIPVNIKLADSDFNETASVDLLLGSGIFWSLICASQIKLNSVILQKTKLGWILSGELINENHIQDSELMTINRTYLTVEDLDDKIERFWQLDEFNTNLKLFTDEEKYCENHFSATTERDAPGKFIIKLPFKSNLNNLCDTFQVAEKRFHLLETRLKNDETLKTEYSKFMNEYIILNHITEIEPSNNQQSFYLPHHCVIKETSETTKLRVVFDGSCKDKNGLSINDVQYTGPTLQDDIFSIIARFRLHKYVVTGDIAKMYRQVWIHPDHRKYQKILWRETPDSKLKTFQLNTVTYGMTAAPYLAIRCLVELANEYKEIHPVESRIILEDFYVDDMITGADNLQELKEIKNNIKSILNSGGFQLRKFKSNSTELCETDASTSIVLNIPDKECKTLGVSWNPRDDQFSYSFSTNLNQSEVTKRKILAITAQLYDPLGLLGPIIILAKLIIQELWQLKLSWDESIPMHLFTEWLNLKNKLHVINKITVPRRILINNHVKIEMHAFADSSERAYGCCIYLRSLDEHNNICVSLLAAKSRVAPLKQTTVPRLELCAAIVAAQLADKFKQILRIKIEREYYWTDSEITLCWIKSNPRRWNTYVANRISEIQRLTDINSWYHVQSCDNPADLISRGVLPDKLIQSNMWWHGPQWLSKDTLTSNDSIKLNEENLPEARKSVQSYQTISESTQLNFIQNFSTLNRLKRVFAYCLRYINNSRKNKSNQELQSGPVTVLEIALAFDALIKLVQRQAFKAEIKQIQTNKIVDNTSKLLSLTPFLDSNGILRVGGRLKLSSFNYDKKHPAVLPKQNHFTTLVFRHFHTTCLHASPKLLLNITRETFWPTSGMNEAKNVVRNCIKCAKFTVKPITPIMGELPIERTMAMYPFHATGVDYAGFYLIKDRQGRGSKVTKCYICLFICFATKCIHLELVTSLHTDTFLLALKRFIARRGKPQKIFSDNGTNFVGANNELLKLGQFLKRNSDEIQNYSANNGIDWKFTPPNSPTFAGLWEAGVKNVKYHLKRVLSNVVLTYEEFNTALAQVESILNSRPLTPLSNDPNDLEILTPAHFLIGRSFTTIPDPELRDVTQNRLTRYQLLQQLNSHFWNNWSRDYINSLQQRQKWKKETSTIKIDSMVLIKDNLPPAQWRCGRVTQLHPGKDGTVRVVTVKCVNGEYKRATNRVCVLPVEVSE